MFIKGRNFMGKCIEMGNRIEPRLGILCCAALWLASNPPLAWAAEVGAGQPANAGGAIVLIFVMVLVMLAMMIQTRADVRRLVKRLEEGGFPVQAGVAGLPQGAQAPQLPPGQGTEQGAIIAAAIAAAFHHGRRVTPPVHMVDPRAKTWGQTGRSRIQQSHNIERKH
jgi:hypothetical protein